MYSSIKVFGVILFIFIYCVVYMTWYISKYKNNKAYKMKFILLVSLISISINILILKTMSKGFENVNNIENNVTGYSGIIYFIVALIPLSFPLSICESIIISKKKIDKSLKIFGITNMVVPNILVYTIIIIDMYVKNYSLNECLINTLYLNTFLDTILQSWFIVIAIMTIVNTVYIFKHSLTNRYKEK